MILPLHLLQTLVSRGLKATHKTASSSLPGLEYLRGILAASLDSQLQRELPPSAIYPEDVVRLNSVDGPDGRPAHAMVLVSLF